MITNLNKIASLAQDPARSHFVNVYSPSGARLVSRAKPENLKNFLDELLRQYRLPYVVVQLRQPNGTSTKKLGETGYPPEKSPMMIREDVANERSPFGGYGSSPRIPGEWETSGGAYLNKPYPQPSLNEPFDRKSIVKVELFDEVKNERDFYKQKYEETKEQLNRLERKLEFLELKQKIDEESKGTEILTEIVSAVAERFATKSGQPTPPGLQGPPEDPNLKWICNTLKELPAEYLPEFKGIINAMINNEEFYKSIREVEKKFGLIKEIKNEPNKD